MAFSTNIEITDSATPLAERMVLALRADRIGEGAGRAVSNQLRKHFFALNKARPNQLGGKRTNFYNQAARSITYRLTSSGVTVSINKLGIRQRLQGGRIKPTRGRRYLTIPAAPEAYGTRAGEWHNLKFGFAFNKKGEIQPALIEAQSTGIKFGKRRRKDGTFSMKRSVREGGKPMFWLVRSVNQRPDPTVLPSMASIQQTAVDAVRKLVDREIRGGNARRKKS